MTDETTNKQIWTIRQGDATDFADNKSLTIDLSDAPVDLIGYTGRFELGKRLYKDYSDLTSKSIEVVLSASETASLPAGNYSAAFKVFDKKGRPCTVLVDISCEVLPMVVRNVK